VRGERNRRKWPRIDVFQPPPSIWGPLGPINATAGAGATRATGDSRSLPDASYRVVPDSESVKLSIIIPVYNEEQTIAEVVNRVLAVDLGSIEKEIIISNDG